jgi:hypothetical protein
MAFVLGSWFSPMVKTLKKEAQYWRGLAGKQKAEANATKKESGLDGLLGDSPLAKLAKPAIEDLLKDPAKLEGILSKFGIGAGGDKQPSTSEWR